MAVKQGKTGTLEKAETQAVEPRIRARPTGGSGGRAVALDGDRGLGQCSRDFGHAARSSGECNGDASGGMGKPAVELVGQLWNRGLKG